MRSLWTLVTLAGAAAMAYGYWAWAEGTSWVAWAPWVAVSLVVACTGAYFVGASLQAVRPSRMESEEE